MPSYFLVPSPLEGTCCAGPERLSPAPVCLGRSGIVVGDPEQDSERRAQQQTGREPTVHPEREVEQANPLSEQLRRHDVRGKPPSVCPKEGRAQQVFNQLGQEPYRETNEIAQGAAQELQKGLGEAHQSPELVDSVIVSAAIKVEYFEIASYRALTTAAQQMGQDEIVNLLNENLQQEEEAAQIAEQSAPELIQKAMQLGGGQQEDKGLIDQAKDKLTGQ